MFPALAGDAQPLDFHGAPVGDDVILEGAPILLAVVAVLNGAEDPWDAGRGAVPRL